MEIFIIIINIIVLVCLIHWGVALEIRFGLPRALALACYRRSCLRVFNAEYQWENIISHVYYCFIICTFH